MLAAAVAVIVPGAAQANWAEPAPGPLNFSPSDDSPYATIATIGGDPWVAWSENNGTNRQLYVKRLVGGSWVQVGSGSLNRDATKEAALPVIADVGGTAYVTWQESTASAEQVYVDRWNGSTWEPVGTATLDQSSSETAFTPTIADVGGVPYVAFTETNGTRYQTYVKRLSGTTWSLVGGGSLNVSTTDDALDVAMTVIGGVPYVAGLEGGYESGAIFVKRWTGSTWETVGANSIAGTSPNALVPRIVGVGGVPYVSWIAAAAPSQLHVDRLEGTDWAAVGGSLNTDTTQDASNGNIAVVGGVLYVGWAEAVSGGTQIHVRRFDGSGWPLVGDPLNDGPTVGAALYASAVTDVGGVPYVAWIEGAGGKESVRVKRLEPDVLSESASPTITGATLSAQIDDHNAPLPLAFQFGAGALGSSTPLGTTAGTGTSTFTQQLTGLVPATAYLYRAFSTDGLSDFSLGPTQSFTTPTSSLGLEDIISHLTLSPSTIVAASLGPSVIAARAKRHRKPGAVISYAGTQVATTTFTVQKPAAGRRSGRRCARPTRHNRRHRRCIRYVSVGHFQHQDVVGVNRFRFTGRVGGHTLRPGRYRLVAVARDAAGPSRPVFHSFRVVRG